MMLGAQAGSQVKQEEVTEKMLEDLKQKLLSSRDKYILSSKDTLPDFGPESMT